MEKDYLENLVKTRNIQSVIDTEIIWGQNKYHNNSVIKPIKSLTMIDEGGKVTRIWYCTVHMYNKDKPGKHLVVFFILADTKYFLSIILMCTKVRIQQTLASTHNYTT